MTVRWFLEPHEVTSHIDRLNGLLDLSVELLESPFPQDVFVDLCAFDIIDQYLFPLMVSAVAQHHGDDQWWPGSAKGELTPARKSSSP